MPELIIITAFEYASLRGRISQLEEDLALAERAMQAALEMIEFEMTSSVCEPLPSKVRVRNLLKSALRI